MQTVINSWDAGILGRPQQYRIDPVFRGTDFSAKRDLEIREQMETWKL